jgi:DNA invertase Pin-like site-specific DNA recombinase
MVNAVAYYRISDMDAGPDSVDPEEDLRRKIWYQREWGRAEAQRRGLNLVKEYEERHTGTALSRPIMNRLLEELSTLKVEVVLIHSDDRLARDDLVARELIDAIEERGAHVLFGNISLEGMADAADRNFFLRIKFLLSQWERDKIVQRLARGAERARAEGTLFARIPRHFVEREGLVYPDDDALAMAKMRERGATYTAIASRFDTYSVDVQRTLKRVAKWRADRSKGVAWRRGKKHLRLA